MKEKFIKMINEKREQLNNLEASMIASENKEERAAIGETLKKLRDEIDDIQEIIDELDKPADADKTKIVVEGNDDTVKDGSDDGNRSSFRPVASMRNASKDNDAETRAANFKKTNAMKVSNAEARAVLVSSGSIATPTEVDGIRDLFNGVSSIVDLVRIVDASGMGAYKVAYQITDAVADNQTEGDAYNASDPTFGFTTISPASISVISYISKQVQKQSPLNYEGKVRESSYFALRKKAAAIITNAILTAATGDNPLVDTVDTITAIDASTLRTIAMNYGGDENVVGGAWLFLNKADLIKFGDVRSSTTLQTVYEITPDTNNPNTGIIKDGGLSVRYCIDSDLTENTMLYGQPYNAECALFSDYDVRVSEDFMFNKGLLAIRGDAEIGAGVTKVHGFVKYVITPAQASETPAAETPANGGDNANGGT